MGSIGAWLNLQNRRPSGITLRSLIEAQMPQSVEEEVNVLAQAAEERQKQDAAGPSFRPANPMQSILEGEQQGAFNALQNIPISPLASAVELASPGAYDAMTAPVEGANPEVPNMLAGLDQMSLGGLIEGRTLGGIMRTQEPTLQRPARIRRGSEREFSDWYGASKVGVDEKGEPVTVFHGSQRPDRIGKKFDPRRATSGPMAFFTEDPELGSKYAEGKRDTSLEAPSDYAAWFKYKPQGSRSEVDIDRAWWHLSPEQRQEITDKLPRVGYSDETDYSKGFAVGEDTGLAGRDHWDYEIKQAKGNVLKAAKEVWLNSGQLINDEGAFLDILKLGGMDMAKTRLDDPNAVYSGVIPAHLSIQNPLDVENPPDNLVDTLQKAANRTRKKTQQYGADPWDKNTRGAQEWMTMLRENPSTAWTSIPDWVTKELKSMGFDGIKDTGGKRGGKKHTVWIPFEPTQVKSATGNRGTYDPSDPRIDR